MEKLKFHLTINAPKEKVWQTLWNDDTYRKWTTPFHAGSYAKGEWKEGADIEFLVPEGDGMYSRIKKLVPNQQMTFEHLGEIKGGEKQPQSKWAGALESYYLSEQNGITELVVETDMEEEHLQYFKDTFPKALQLIKELSEARETASAV